MRDMTIERHEKPRRPTPLRSEEYIDIGGHLRVPVASSWNQAPEREGWEPFFVNINLNKDDNHGIEKVVIYRRKED